MPATKSYGVLKPGDLVVLLPPRNTYVGVDRSSNSWKTIRTDEVCVWLGKDPSRIGERTLPRVFFDGVIVEVSDEKIFIPIAQQNEE